MCDVTHSYVRRDAAIFVTFRHQLTPCSVLQCVAVCCSVLKCGAVCYSVLLCGTACCCSVCCSVLLQCVVAVCCCSVLLQCVVAACCCSVRVPQLQYVCWCSVLLQCVVAVCCYNIVQCVAVSALHTNSYSRESFYACCSAWRRDDWV